MNSRRNQAQFGMVPANSAFGADQRAVSHVHLWLKMDEQLIVLYRTSQHCFQTQAVESMGGHFLTYRW